MSAGGIKEGFTMPHMYRSQIHLASLRSVLLPFCGFVYFGCANVTQQVFSRMLNTGIQYFPVDSIQTSAQECFVSHPANSRSPLENEEKRACLYSVRPFASVIPIQAKIHVLWTSSPQQFLRRILKATLNLLHIKIWEGPAVTDYPAKSSRFERDIL